MTDRTGLGDSVAQRAPDRAAPGSASLRSAADGGLNPPHPYRRNQTSVIVSATRPALGRYRNEGGGCRSSGVPPQRGADAPRHAPAGPEANWVRGSLDRAHLGRFQECLEWKGTEAEGESGAAVRPGLDWQRGRRARAYGLQTRSHASDSSPSWASESTRRSGPASRRPRLLVRPGHPASGKG